MKDLNKEVELLDSCNRIKDKLMILSLYSDFSSNALNVNYDSASLNHMEIDLEAAFSITVSGIEKSDYYYIIDLANFMKIFLDTLDYMIMFNGTREKEMINEFKNNVYDLNKLDDYVKVIDSYPFDLKTKTEIMQLYNKYLKKMNQLFVYNYGDKESVEVRNCISDMLLNKLKIYLDECKDSNKFNYLELHSILKENTKNYLIKLLKITPDTFNDFNFKSNTSLYDSLNDLEKKLYLISNVYIISGYENPINSKNKEVINEICKEFNISKMSFRLSSLLITIKSMKTSNNGFNDEIKQKTYKKI